jgi:predicted esterase
VRKTQPLSARLGVCALVAAAALFYLSARAPAPPMAASAALAAGAARTCIFLHGLGDSSAGWSFLRGEFAARAPQLKWVFPDSPVQPVTLAGGDSMPSWMDLDDLPVTAHTPEDRAGFEASTKIIHALIDKEVAAGVPASSIYLGGFSQGACAHYWVRKSHFIGLPI